MTVAVVELVRVRLGQTAQHVDGDAVGRARVAHSMVHLVGREEAGDGAGLVHDALDLLEHAALVAIAAVDAPVARLLVEAGDVTDDPPAPVLVCAAARPGREHDGEDVEAPGRVVVQEVTDRAPVDAGL